MLSMSLYNVVETSINKFLSDLSDYIDIIKRDTLINILIELCLDQQVINILS